MISTATKSNYGHGSILESSRKNGRVSDTRKEQENNKDRVFKRSIDKIKTTFFSGVRDNRELTIQTLKEIGKHAKTRA